MKDLKILQNQQDFDTTYPNGVPSKDVVYIKENGTILLSTNNVNGEFEQIRAYEGGSFDPSDLSIYLTKDEYELDSSAFITSNDVSQFTTSDDISVFLTSVDVSKMALLDGHNLGNFYVGDNTSTHSYAIGSRKSYSGDESISVFQNDGYKTNISNRVNSYVNARILLDANGATIQFSGDAHTAYSSGQLERIATQEWVELDISTKLESNDVSQFLTSADMSSYATKQDISTFCTLSDVQSEGYLKDNDVSLLITEDDLNYETWIFTLSDDSSISKNIVVK